MRSLTLKLILAFLIVSLTGAVLTSFIIQQRTRSEFTRYLSDQLQSNMISALTQYYRENGDWDGVDQLMRELERTQRIPSFNPPSENNPPPPDGRRIPLVIVDANRSIIYGSTDSLGRRATDEEISQGVPLEIDGNVMGWLSVNASIIDRMSGSPENRFLETINQVILISGLAAVGVALLLGIALARNLTRPIRELTDATQALAKGDLGRQVSIRSKDELGRLATSFNKMSADLANATQARRQMTADIAHDLRSPLSVILGYTEALSDGKLEGQPEIYEVMHKEAGHLNRLIDDLRTLSLADAGELALIPQEMQPNVLLERAAIAHRPLCEQKGIQMELELKPDLPSILVDPERMAQVLGNLLANAIRYAPADGQIRLFARLLESKVELHVWDNGPGIALAEHKRVFDRFYRSDEARTHNGETGLGLAIARSLVEAQGGKILLESEPGLGAHFIISFPRS